MTTEELRAGRALMTGQASQTYTGVPMDQVTCDELAGLMRTADNVAVLLILRDGEMQLVTYGRSAEDKAEAHELKEWIKDDVFDGNPPKARTSESFILDAAEVKQERDALLKFKEYVHARLDAAGVPTDPESPHRAEGCRIGGRLDVLLNGMAELVLAQLAVEMCIAGGLLTQAKFDEAVAYVKKYHHALPAGQEVKPDGQ